MYRYFTAKRTRRYIDVLTDLIHSYKDTHHRSISMAPIEVTAVSEDVVRWTSCANDCTHETEDVEMEV